MKKMGIMVALLVFLMTSLVFAQDEAPSCEIVVSGSAGTEGNILWANVKNFRDGRLRIEAQNRSRSMDFEIVRVEVVGINARGNEVELSFRGRKIKMPKGYDGILPRNSGKVDIEIKEDELAVLRRVSRVTVITDICP
jgi:hypothetical protein